MDNWHWHGGSEEGRLPSFAQFLVDLRKEVREGHVTQEVFDEVLDCIGKDRDGEYVHNITDGYRVCLYALGADDLADSIVRADLILVMPMMALGLRGKAKGDFDPDQLTEANNRAMLSALRGVLALHGMRCTISDEGRLEPIQEQDPWEETIEQFRQELDDPNNPMSRWLRPKQGDNE